MRDQTQKDPADKPGTETRSVEITAVVITYNSSDHIVDSVKSLERALDDIESEILVVDNASADDTTEKAERALKQGLVIRNDENAGYAKAANIGLRNARGRLTLVMNDDAALEPGAIERMIEVLDSSDEIALVGPRIVDSEGRPTHSARMHYPGPSEEWARLRDLVTGASLSTDYPANKEPEPVHWLIAACVLGETELLREIGGFNEQFFLYGEDIDLGRRIRALGYLSVTVPDAKCVHMGEVSTSKTYTSDARSMRQVSGRSVYYRIWLPRWIRFLVYLRRAIGIQMQPERLKTYLKLALWDGPSLAMHRFPEPLQYKPNRASNS